MKHFPRCQHTHFVKNGYVHAKQRYKCKNCQYQWTRTTPRGKPQTHKTLAVLLYCHGISMNAISKLFNSHVTTVLKWIRTYAKKYAPKPTLSPGTPVVLELDEMWKPYIGNKKNKLWIWKALDRNTGHLIDWQCGGRNAQTLEKLIHRLAALKVKMYYTDKWQVYEAVLPPSKLIQTKAETHRIERNNCLMRHWFGRFKRKSIIVSKSVEMVNLTIALFARFRVNGDVFDILKLGGMETMNIIS